MYVLIDNVTLKLRGTSEDPNYFILQGDKVVTPTKIITDLNKTNAMVRKYNKELPVNWRNYDWYYNIGKGIFQRVMPRGNELVFIED